MMKNSSISITILFSELDILTDGLRRLSLYRQLRTPLIAHEKVYYR